jgi:molecular chaperone HscB
MNHFELYEISPDVIIDVAAITTKYYQLSKQYHPDRVGASADVLQLSEQVNEAYQIFKNPEALLKYYLEVNEIIIPGEVYNLPPAFLMDMMEQNEAITEAKQAGENLETYKLEAEVQYTQKLSALQNAIIAHSDIKIIKQQYYELKYYQRLLSIINNTVEL